MKVCVIGGGAAGMMAAHIAAKNGHSVTLIDKMPRIGKKILATGGGRCNLTNEDCDISHFHGGNIELINSVISGHNRDAVLKEFSELGLFTVSKNGYVYPYNEQASTVLDVLRIALKYDNVEIITECNINDIRIIDNTEGRFLILTDKDDYRCDRLIISAGSKASPKTGSDGSGYKLAQKLGHKIIKPLPALCALRCEEDFFKSVSGIRCKGRIILSVDGYMSGSDKGELQLTNYGISGIPAMQLSHIAAKAIDSHQKVSAHISFLPEHSHEEIKHIVLERIELNRSKTAEELLVGLFHKNLYLLMLKKAGIKNNCICGKLTLEDAERLSNQIADFTVNVIGTNGFDECQVCQGGVDLSEVKTTMESKIVDGLYFAGEILDVHGDCGGYNLQWAWSTGMLSGRLL